MTSRTLHDMTSAEPAAPPLLEIPVELFQHIAEYTGPAGLKSLRLVCREAQSKVLQVYLPALFTSLGVIMSDRASLEAAVEAAAHPLIGPTIKTLTIYGDGLGYGIPWRQKEIYIGQKWALQSSPTLETRFKAALEKQREFRQRGGIPPLLRKLFSQLQSLGNVKEVQITSVHRNYRQPFRSHDLASFGSYGGIWSPGPERTEWLHFLTERLIESAICSKLTSLTLDTSEYGSIPMFNLAGLLNTVQYLDIHLHQPKKFQRYTCMEKTANAIASAPNLKSLRLKTSVHNQYGFPWRADLIDLPNMNVEDRLMKKTIPKLETLTLVSCHIDHAELLAFLGMQPKLRKLALKFCRLTTFTPPLDRAADSDDDVAAILHDQFDIEVSCKRIYGLD